MTTALVREIAESLDVLLEPLTVEQYHTMLTTGILREGAPIELIDGLLVQKDRRDAGSPGMTVGTRHSYCVRKIDLALAALNHGCLAHVASQQPVTLTTINEPEPDAAIIRGTLDQYREQHPGPDDVLLVVEVSDRSLSLDRTTKQRLYAVAGIPSYWIVDLKTNQIEVYEQPNAQQERYESVARYGIDDIVRFTVGSQALELQVRDVL